MKKRFTELQQAVESYTKREILQPGLWTEELAAAKGKLCKFEAEYGVSVVGEDTFRTVRVFPTKDDADGPLPKTLLRLIKKNGGAAIIELLPSGDYKIKGDMLVSPNSSRPRYYVRAFHSDQSWDGYPVCLTPSHLKRLGSY
jgi:hypothetical protein